MATGTRRLAAAMGRTNSRVDLAQGSEDAGYLVEALTVLAQMAAEQETPEGFAESSLGVCQAALGAEEAVIVLNDPKTGLRIAAASSDSIRAVVDYGLASGMGPLADCFRFGRSVRTAFDDTPGYWSTFVTLLRQCGLNAVLAEPLGDPSAPSGVLAVCGADPSVQLSWDRPLSGLSAILSALMDQVGARHELAVRATQLQGALNSRVVIEQAKGVLAERQGIAVDEAFDRLRRAARNGGRRLDDICRAVVSGAGIRRPSPPLPAPMPVARAS